MSKKRTSPESGKDSETIRPTEDSDSMFQQNDDADDSKRAKLTTSDKTKLENLPMDLLGRILVQSVAMETMDMTGMKSTWKVKAGHVINRLAGVCSQWQRILTSNSFRCELDRTFDAEKTIRLEVSQQSHLQIFACAAVTLKDELFVLCSPDDYYTIHVYDRNNVAHLKGVLQLLPEVELKDFAACGVSNCLYILNNEQRNLSVLRITKTNEHRFDISPLISHLKRRNDAMSVASNGNLVLSWQKATEIRGVFTVYDPNGQFVYETLLVGDICRVFYKVIPKTDGGFVLVSSDDSMKTKLTEIGMYGGIQRQYQSSLLACHNACQADASGRILIAEGLNKIELLDADFNLLEFTGPQLEKNQLRYCGRMSYNSERNEVVTFAEDEVLTIFRFTKA